MPKFSAPERFLLEQWTEARILEDAMEMVRSKYKEIVDQVLEGVIKSHHELDCSKMRVGSNYGGIAIGKESWPKNPNAWPAGFYIEDLRLDDLISKERLGPFTSVWAFDPRGNPKEMAGRLQHAAKKVLASDELPFMEHGYDSKNAWIGRSLEQTQSELFQLLLSDEAQGFVDCMLGHFEWLAKFTTILDELLATSKRTRK